jgi:hypothetical protein
VDNHWTHEEIFLARRTFAIADEMARQRWERIETVAYAIFMVTFGAVGLHILYGG